MNEITIPDEEVRNKTLIKLRETNHRLDALGLAMDDLLGTIEQELRCQRRERWRKKDAQLSQKITGVS